MADIQIAGATYNAVPSIIVPKVGGGNAQFYDMSGDMAWLGKGAELVGQNFYKKSDTLDNTLYNGWTPSTTAKAIVATATLSDAKFTASDIDQYAYYIFWECGVVSVRQIGCSLYDICACLR